MSQVGLWRNDAHEYFANYDGVATGPYANVTGIIKSALDKPALLNWMAKTVAEFAVERAELIADMRRSGGAVETAKWVSSQARRSRDAAGKVGTEVHEICDRIAKGEAVFVPDEQQPFIDAFRRDFLDAYLPTIELSEFMVVNDTVGYAGTGDLMARLKDPLTAKVERWCLDIKTGRYVYPEHSWQLAAIAKGEYWGAPGDPVKHKLPPATRFGVLHLRPEGCRLVEYAVTKDTWDAFKAAVVIHRWVNGEAKQVIGGKAA